MPKVWQRKLWAAKQAAHTGHSDGSRMKREGSSGFHVPFHVDIAAAPPTFMSLAWEFLEETSSHGLGEGA